MLSFLNLGDLGTAFFLSRALSSRVIETLRRMKVIVCQESWSRKDAEKAKFGLAPAARYCKSLTRLRDANGPMELLIKIVQNNHKTLRRFQPRIWWTTALWSAVLQCPQLIALDLGDTNSKVLQTVLSRINLSNLPKLSELRLWNDVRMPQQDAILRSGWFRSDCCPALMPLCRFSALVARGLERQPRDTASADARQLPRHDLAHRSPRRQRDCGTVRPVLGKPACA